jgi:aminopeptidase N
MEHQSSVTYGNGYQNGYRGRDLSGTGWGMKFDFIIIHEAGHEWFANNITYKDEADMWIHESFTNYSESLFLDYHYGKEAGQAYVRGTRMNILNDKPIIGDYGVNQRGSGDMYYKGGNLLNMLRQILQDDEKWRQILRGLNETFYHQTVTTAQVESYISKQMGMNLSKVFDQYLRDARIPILEYYQQDGALHYRWISAVKDFDMPVDVLLDGSTKRLQPKTSWQKLAGAPVQVLVVDPDYYVGVSKSRE